MITRAQWDRFIDRPVVEWTIFGIGLLLMLLSPLAGVIPGPGGILVFALGLAMVLKTSMWAKRHYVKFKRWQPKAGRWVDWGLRRSSAKRRAAMRRERDAMDCPPPPDEIEQGPIAATIPDPPATTPETWAEREGRAETNRPAD
ncbi:MAG: hypothetical protein ABIP91_00095 [Sphingomicrobium sp.]